jgi:hypothetical protein
MSMPQKPIVIIAVLLALMLVSFSFAQDKPAPKAAAAQTPQMVRVTITHIPSAVAGEWQDFQKNTFVPLMRKMGVTYSTVWRTATFGVAGEFLIARPIKDLAELDAASPLVNTLGQEVSTALSAGIAAKLQQFNASSRTFMITTRPDLSTAVAPGYVPKLAVMVTTSVAPGRTDEYEKGCKELVAAVGKTNAKGVLVSKTGLGGDPNEYRMFVLFDSFADLGNFPAAFTKASAEVKLIPMPAGIVMHTEWSVFRHVPELSIQAAAPKSEK